MVPKFAIHNKLIQHERQKNSTHRFGDTHLTYCLAKFLQDRIKPESLGAIIVNTGYQFLKKNS